MRTDEFYQDQSNKDQRRLILALTEKVADLEAENASLRRALSEADRTNAFYRYHRGGKS